MTLSIFSPIEEDLKKCEAFSKKNLSSKVKLVLSAANYILDSGGKRIRPALTILCGRLFNAREERLIPIATVMEYMHTATLLHDDIVDGAKLRRGRQSANEVFGNDVAVLVGDYMFAKAIHTLAEYGGNEVLKVAAKSVQEMSEGELKQLEFIGSIDVKENDYLYIIYCKTASLMSTACECGAIIGNANPVQREALKNFGKNLGMAFQLIDDALDYTSSDEEMGKKPGSDIREGKATYPLLSILKECSDGEVAFLKKVFSSRHVSEDDINSVRQLVKKHGGVEKTINLAKSYIEKSKEHLADFPESKFLSTLKKIADFVGERNF